jgi:hypothetical protein
MKYQMVQRKTGNANKDQLTSGCGFDFPRPGMAFTFEEISTSRIIKTLRTMNKRATNAKEDIKCRVVIFDNAMLGRDKTEAAFKRLAEQGETRP